MASGHKPCQGETEPPRKDTNAALASGGRQAANTGWTKPIQPSSTLQRRPTKAVCTAQAPTKSKNQRLRAWRRIMRIRTKTRRPVTMNGRGIAGMRYGEVADIGTSCAFQQGLGRHRNVGRNLLGFSVDCQRGPGRVEICPDLRRKGLETAGYVGLWQTTCIG
jgi:hypothetical protein